jgi:hypothetical protein
LNEVLFTVSAARTRRPQYPVATISRYRRRDPVPMNEAMVHSSELERIRIARDARGLRPCDTPCAGARLEKEHRLRTATGNYGCVECGADTFSWSQYRTWLRSSDEVPLAQHEGTNAG